MPPDELEGPEKNSDTDSNAVGEEEALAEIADGVGDAGLIGVVALRVVEATGVALAPLQLLYGLPEPFLGLPEPVLGRSVGVFAAVRRRRRRCCCGGLHFGQRKSEACRIRREVERNTIQFVVFIVKKQ